MNKAAIVSTPLTAVSIIEAFGDIKDFQPWAENVLSAVAAVKALLFWPLSFVGIHFSDIQQSLLVIAGILFFSHLASIQKFNASFDRDQMATVRSNTAGPESITRPTYKFYYYVSMRKQTAYYLLAVSFGVLSSQSVNPGGISSFLTDLLFYLIVVRAFSDIFTTYTILPAARKYSLREAASALAYMRYLRRTREQGMIDDRYMAFEKAHISRVMTKLRYDYEATQRITRLALLELAGVLIVVAALLAAFVMIRY